MLRKSVVSALVSVLVLDGHLSSIVLGQIEAPPPIEWEARFQGKGHATGFAARETKDGGFALAGWTWEGEPIPESNEIPPTDAYLLKTDRTGALLWEKTFGGAGYDVFRRFEETRDGGFILTGWTDSAAGWLVKTDADGNAEWEKTFGGNIGFSVLESDGDYAVVGTKASSPSFESLYFIRVSPNGETISEVVYADSHCERAVGMRETDDGGFLLAASGNRSCGPLGDVRIIRTDSVGNIVGSKTPVATPLFFAAAFDMAPTDDGGSVLSGYVLSNIDFNFKAWILKLDDLDEIAWSQEFGSGDVEKVAFAHSVQPTADGGFIACGRPWLARMDDSGSRTWQLARENADLFSARQTRDGGYIVSGETGERLPLEPGSDCFPFLAAGCIVGDAYLFKVAAASESGARFRRGDSNADGKLDIADSLFTFQHLFLEGPPPACLDSADSDDSGVLNLTDGIYALNYLFLGGAALPAPGPSSCGEDGTEDTLGDCSYETRAGC